MGLPIAVLMLLAGTWVHAAWENSKQALTDDLARFDRFKSIAEYKARFMKPESDAGSHAFDELYLKGGPTAVITADLVSQLKQSASALGLEVTSTNDLKAKTEGPLAFVGISLQMSANAPALYKFIQSIEHSVPYLFVERLDIRSNSGGLNDGNAETLLTVDMQVFGATRTSPAAAQGVAN